MMQNKPPALEGREGDELADVELRPEQVHGHVELCRNHLISHWPQFSYLAAALAVKALDYGPSLRPANRESFT